MSHDGVANYDQPIKTGNDTDKIGIDLIEAECSEFGRWSLTQISWVPLVKWPRGSSAVVTNGFEISDPMFPAFRVLKHAVYENSLRHWASLVCVRDTEPATAQLVPRDPHRGCYVFQNRFLWNR